MSEDDERQQARLLAVMADAANSTGMTADDALQAILDGVRAMPRFVQITLETMAVMHNGDWPMPEAGRRRFLADLHRWLRRWLRRNSDISGERTDP